MALIDSGNGIQNAISDDLARFLKLRRAARYTGPVIGTAKKGSPLNIVGVVKPTTIVLFDRKGIKHRFLSSFLIIKDLSCGMNISGPWLSSAGLDQIHSKGCLRKCTHEFPMYESIQHARHSWNKGKLRKEALNVPPDGEYISTVSDRSIRVFSSLPEETHLSPNTGKLIQVNAAERLTALPRGDNLFNYSTSFLQKMGKTICSEDPNGLISSMNELDQAVESFDGQGF